MRRTITALVISSTVFAGIYGLAASIGVTSTTLGAGSAVVAACQSTAVTVSYTSTFTSGSYKATTVSVGGLDTAARPCGNKSIKVSLSGSAGQLGEQTATTPTSGTSMNLAFTGVEASDVTGVHVAIAG
jgi:hypothetical protein